MIYIYILDRYTYKLPRLKRCAYYGFRSITLPIGRILIFAIRTRCTYILYYIVVIPVIRYRAVCPLTHAVTRNCSLQDVVFQKNILYSRCLRITKNFGLYNIILYYCTHIIIIYISSIRNLPLTYISMDLL